ncbi:MAG TPA: hypothetical protein VE377_10260 [Candidatus Dormibacteraeota bacterium]|nr:hypothetical protein [Candidatus Dormibacteraeota bacterium]
MGYAKGILSGLAALILAELVPIVWSVYRSNAKATGLAVFAAELLENFFSPLFWVLLISSLGLFFAASRSGSTALQVIFFWIPTVTILTVAGAIMGLIALLVIRVRSLPH